MSPAREVSPTTDAATGMDTGDQDCPRWQRAGWRRNASVLLWAPALVLVLLPELDRMLRTGGVAGLLPAALLIGLIVSAATVAVLTSGPRGQGRSPVLGYVAFGVQSVATAATAAYPEAWLPGWILLALTAPSVLRGRWLLGGVPVIVGAATAAAWLVGASPERIAVQGFVVLLALGANTAVVRLIETVDELRRTRQQLAQRAVWKERERFSRDLHDLLGHTLSVMVVKAEAVRRLAELDPAAAAVHAGDIERVGRDALSQVRQAVDGTGTPSLADELAGARRALQPAGVRVEIPDQVPAGSGPIPLRLDRVLAWVVREGVTNVLRHSGAGWCRIELLDDGWLRLRIADDGVGIGASVGAGVGAGVRAGEDSEAREDRDAREDRAGGDPTGDVVGERLPGSGRAAGSRAGTAVVAPRTGGLDGLRRRLSAVGGRLTVGPGPDGNGFVLTASVPRETAGRPEEDG